MSGDSPIVQEVRARRMEISRECGHDPQRLFEELRRDQERYRHRLVSQITVVPSNPPASAR